MYFFEGDGKNCLFGFIEFLCYYYNLIRIDFVKGSNIDVERIFNFYFFEFVFRFDYLVLKVDEKYFRNLRMLGVNLIFRKGFDELVIFIIEIKLELLEFY